MNFSDRPAKYKSIVIHAKELFWNYGFRKVSMEEVCRESKVSKMTLYKYFPNKAALALEVTQWYYEPYKDVITDLMQNREISFKHKIAIAIKLKKQTNGSISLAFHQDVQESYIPEVTDYFGNYYQSLMQIIIEFFEQSKRDGYIRQSISFGLLTAFAEATQTVASKKEIIAEYANMIDLSVELLNLIIYGISPNDNEIAQEESMIESEYHNLLNRHKLNQ